MNAEDQNIKDFLEYSQSVLDVLWNECGIDNKKMTRTLKGEMPLKEKVLISIYSEFLKYYNEKVEQLQEKEAELLKLRQAVLDYLNDPYYSESGDNKLAKEAELEQRRDANGISLKEWQLKQ